MLKKARNSQKKGLFGVDLALYAGSNVRQCRDPSSLKDVNLHIKSLFLYIYVQWLFHFFARKKVSK